jgi:hypothetical protein
MEVTALAVAEVQRTGHQTRREQKEWVQKSHISAPPPVESLTGNFWHFGPLPSRPSAPHELTRTSAAAASGLVKTMPLLPRRGKGLPPVPGSCLQLDARPAPALEDVSQERVGWVGTNSSIYVHQDCTLSSRRSRIWRYKVAVFVFRPK